MRQSTPNILDNMLGGATPAPPESARPAIALAAIVNDGGTQMRAGIDTATVLEYEEAIKAASGAWPFPAVVVYHDGAKYWLADGFHRVNAAHRAGLTSVPAEVRAGTRRDAILHAAGANASHGLRRTNEDKRRAVEVLLRDEEWSQWSDGAIAKACGVSDRFVGDLSKKLTPKRSESKTRKGADGRTTNTENIGSRSGSGGGSGASGGSGGTASNSTQATARGGFLTVAALEATVRAQVPQIYGEQPQSLAPKDMRTGAQMRAGRLWLACTQALVLQPFRLPDLTTAIMTVADEVQAAQAQAQALPGWAKEEAPAAAAVAEPAPEPVADDATNAPQPLEPLQARRDSRADTLARLAQRLGDLIGVVGALAGEYGNVTGDFHTAREVEHGLEKMQRAVRRNTGLDDNNE